MTIFSRRECNRKLEIHIPENYFYFYQYKLRVICSAVDPLSEVNIFFRIMQFVAGNECGNDLVLLLHFTDKKSCVQLSATLPANAGAWTKSRSHDKKSNLHSIPAKLNATSTQPFKSCL